MADTVRTLSALQTLLADNTSGDISAQDIRDFLVSAWTPEWIQYLQHRMPGETAHTDDDFFDDATITGTEVTPSGTVTWTEKYGVLSVKAASMTSTDISAIVKPLTPSSAPVTIETSTRAVLTPNNNSGVLLGFSTGATASSNIAGYEYFYGGSSSPWAPTTGTFTARSTGTLKTGFRDGLTDRVYVRVIWTGTNAFEIAVSIDGVSWAKMGIADLSTTLTPTHFFVAVEQSASEEQVRMFDYLRVYESDLSV